MATRHSANSNNKPCHFEQREKSRKRTWIARVKREILDFSPFGLTAKADASGVDLKVRYAQDDKVKRKDL